MKKCSRLVLNSYSRMWQAVAGTVSGHGRGLMAATTLAAIMPLAHAAPVTPSTDDNGLHNLGTLSGGNYSSAYKISADGKTIVGSGDNSSGNSRAIYWTADNGMVDLGSLSAASWAYSYANGVNADGSVIVGSTVSDHNGSSPSRAFRWTLADGMVDLGTLETSASTAPYSGSNANGVNDDGTVVVGEAVNDDGQLHAFRWVEGNGMSQLFTSVNGNTISTSNGAAVNKVGDVVVGSYDDGDNQGAFRWTTTDGVEALGALDKDTNTSWSSIASGVNAAGNVVTGISSQGGSSTANRAFRWTAETGMVSLGVIDSSTTATYANAINGSGNVIVGTAENGTTSQGFRWEAGIGMQTVEQWLEASGVDTSALTDTAASAGGVNEDGSIVVGTLSNNRAYIARGATGMVDIAAFNTSLTRTAASVMITENQHDLIFHGMHGNPMQMLLKNGESGFWVAGDFGRQERDLRKGDMAVGEIGYGHRLNDAAQVNIAGGYSYSSTGTDYNGKTRAKSFFVLPELIMSLPGSAYLTLSGIYGKGKANIDRGYLNAGTENVSKGSPDTTTYGARIRLDWREVGSIGKVWMTPYVALSYLQTQINAYTETGGGFAARWDKRTEKATTARLGMDLTRYVSDTTKLTGRIEGVHRFQKRSIGASGETIGISTFAFSGQKLKRNWLRAGAGLEGKVGSGIASATINGTTEGETAAYWLAVNYRWQF